MTCALPMAPIWAMRASACSGFCAAGWAARSTTSSASATRGCARATCRFPLASVNAMNGWPAWPKPCTNAAGPSRCARACTLRLGRRWRFNRCSRFGGPLEGGLFFANFTHSRGSFFDHRSFCSRFDYWLRLNRWSWLNGNHVGFWLCIANRGNFHFRNHWGFDRGRGFNDWRFNNRHFNRWGFGGWRFYGNSVFDGSGSTFGLLVSLGFSRCADD